MWATSPCERLSAVGPVLLPALLDTAIKGAVILSLTALVTLALRRASAAARHLVWFLGTLSLLVLPILSAAMPGWYVLPRWASYAAQSPRVPHVVPTAGLLPSAPDTQFPPGATPLRAEMPMPALPPTAPGPSAPTPEAVSTPLRLAWQAWVVLAWLAGSVFYLGYVALGFVSLWWLQRRSARITMGSWPVLLREACGQLRFRRPVELISSPCRAMPMTWGLWRTRLLLPADSANWTVEQRRAVLLHELAHAKRLDCLTQFVVQIVCALHWINPLPWLAWRRMQAEREQACDDLVLAAGTKASDYAQQLLHIASEMPPVRCSAAAIAMARPSKLEGRLLAILDTSRNRRLAARTVVGVSLAICISVLALAALRADETPSSPAFQSVSRWAAHYGWKAQLVARTTLESKWGGGGGWRDLPFSLDKDEETDARACIALSGKTRSSVNGKTEFSEPATRAALEEILKKRPDYFYAEFLLAHWRRDRGDPEQAARLLDAAYRHAPVIIVQRFEFADGSPLANTAISSFALECNRVKKGSLDPSLQLSYPDLKTDADGCIYLPVYDTVYRTNDMSWPDGYSVSFPPLGWFETSRKVAMLPVATVTPKPGDFGNVPLGPGDVPGPSSKPIAATPSAPASQLAADISPWRAKLPCGATVELVGVTENSSTEKPFWRPDGSPLARPPEHYPDRAQLPKLDRSGNDFMILVSSLSWSRQPGDYEVLTQIQPAPGPGNELFSINSATWRDSIYPPMDSPDGPKYSDVYVLSRSFSKPAGRASIEFGLAAGPWETIASDPISGGGSSLALSGIRGTNLDVSFGVPYTASFPNYKPLTVHITVAHNVPPRHQVRVIAILADGSETVGADPVISDGHVRQIAQAFRRGPGARDQDMVAIKDIKEFRLQSRPFQWAEFRDITLIAGAAAVPLAPSASATQQAGAANDRGPEPGHADRAARLTAQLQVDKVPASQPSATWDPPQGLVFLKTVPELKGVSLKMSEREFQEMVKLRSLTFQKTRDDDGGASYRVSTDSGENVIVMFDKDGACRGIQRLQPSPATVPSDVR